MELKTPELKPRPAGFAGRARPYLAAILLLIGGLIVIYPLIPKIWYSLHRPTSSVPYQTKLSANNDVWKNLPELPDISNRPAPSDNRLVIPRIGIDMAILEGSDEKVLDRGGVWHIPNTSSPDKGGNVVLSGHRWRYLPPSSMTLYLLDKVKDGDPIIVYWKGQEYDYRVTGRETVTPDRTDILAATESPRLTIYTCTPLFSTKYRLVLFAQLIS